MAVIHLVRHGQASFAAAEYDKLSPLGVRQARVLGEALRSRLPSVDRVMSGSMARQRDTATECLAAMRHPVAEDSSGPGAVRLEIDPRWDEYDHREVIERHLPTYQSGVDEPTAAVSPKEAFRAMFDSALTRWTAGENDDDYIEAWAAFASRAWDASHDLTARLTRSQHAVVFTSGGVISAVTARLLGGDSQLWLKLSQVVVNTGVTKLVHGQRGVTLVSFNDHSHVPDELLTYR
ncbi:MAG: histidine phosphatase family protein [Micromonosporaceae bacterium]